MLTTLLAPTAGDALVAGHSIVREAEAVRLRIGVALQEAALDPKQTGRELLDMQGRLYGLSRSDRDQRVAERLELVSIGDAIDRRIGTYSGGMKRRLDLAAALVHQPEVLFLDEPTTGLDPVSRMEMWDVTRELVQVLIEKDDRGSDAGGGSGAGGGRGLNACDFLGMPPLAHLLELALGELMRMTLLQALPVLLTLQLRLIEGVLVALSMALAEAEGQRGCVGVRVELTEPVREAVEQALGVRLAVGQKLTVPVGERDWERDTVGVCVELRHRVGLAQGVGDMECVRDWLEQGEGVLDTE
jgi:hypothetical protein